MKTDEGFRTAYRKLEARMRALAEADGDIFLPNPEPLGKVEYVFVCRRFVITTDSDHRFAVYSNLARDMKINGINQLWIADLTYIRLQHEFMEGVYNRKRLHSASTSRIAARIQEEQGPVAKLLLSLLES